MANVPISTLPAGSALLGSEEAPFVQGGTTVKITADQLRLFTFGSLVSVAPGAGAHNDFTPGTWNDAVGRLDVDVSAGNINLTGLLALDDGAAVLIRVSAGANLLTLNNQNAGSTAANRFASSGDLVLTLGQRTMAVYYGGSINRWSIA